MRQQLAVRVVNGASVVEPVDVEPARHLEQPAIEVLNLAREIRGTVRPFKLETVKLEEGTSFLPFRVQDPRLVEKDFPDSAEDLRLFQKHPLRAGENDDQLTKRVGMGPRMPFRAAPPPTNFKIAG